MTQHVPASTAIRTRSIPNVDTDRLVARIDWFRTEWRHAVRDFDQKSEVRSRAREVVNVERELRRRGVTFDPVTDGHHFAVDVWAVPAIRER